LSAPQEYFFAKAQGTVAEILSIEMNHIYDRNIFKIVREARKIIREPYSSTVNE